MTIHLANGQQQTFSLEQLQRLPHASIRLRSAVGDPQTWTGVPLQRLLAEVPGADNGRPLHTSALNHYSVVVPYEDILRYQPLVAYKLNGQFMSIRDHGPLYLIYPFDDHPELHQQLFYNRSIWQLSDIHTE
ncbi:molybdopterin-dependent oxidoreductase [Pseudomonas sp. SH1-B]